MNDPELARLLERALHETLDDDPVDVTTLAARTRRRVRRRSATRPIQIVLTCAVAAAVVAVATGGIGGLQTPFRLPVRPEAPVVVVTTPTPTEAAFSIPASVGLTALELPDAQRFERGVGEKGDLPPITNQQCDSSRGRWPAVVKRWYLYLDEKQAMNVDLIVTGYPTGTGAAAFEKFVDQTGACWWLHRPAKASTQGLRGDDVWAGSRRSEVHGGGLGFAVVRYGDVMVSVSVNARRQTPAQATALATSLVQVAAERVRRQVPQAQPR